LKIGDGRRALASERKSATLWQSVNLTTSPVAPAKAGAYHVCK
jgi:hypothetical protein